MDQISSREESMLSVHSAVAVPEGEAHRHEPPIPQDEVRVDSRKNNIELQQEKKQAGSPEEGAREEPRKDELGPGLKANDRKDENDEEKKPEAAGSKEEGKVGGHAVANEVLEKPVRDAGVPDSAPLKEVEKPVKDAANGNAAMAADQAAVAQVEEAAKRPNAAEKGFVGEHHPAADGGAAADSKDTADDKMDEESIQEEGAAKAKESVVESDLKAAGAGGEEAAVVDQKQDPAGNTGAEDEAAKGAGAAAYKEDANVAPGGESEQQRELGARGVQLEKKRPDEPQNDQASQVKDEDKATLVKLNRDINRKMSSENVLEREKLQREMKEKDVDVQLAKELLEKERQEKLAIQQQLEKERAEKERIEKEVQLRVEKERLERERREKLIREQEAEKAKLAEKLQQVDSEINERAKKELETKETQERLAQLRRAIEARNAENAAQRAEGEDAEALKSGGRDLKEKAPALLDPGEGAEDGAVRAEARLQGSHEKLREQVETDLKRRKRELGPGEAAGFLKDPRGSRGVPGLEPLLELGGSDLHAALEQQLLAGAVVHSRQIKQATEDDGAK
ncbi:hypothetical protein XENOCAPTIV_003175 [Xenoophorus captivus]|uniref:Uncharacterized protein n=1 Tax=Xenoophorus captivus TaxID=1517983 RepID=A0ABV0RPW5_9TELE